MREPANAGGGFVEGGVAGRPRDVRCPPVSLSVGRRNGGRHRAKSTHDRHSQQRFAVSPVLGGLRQVSATQGLKAMTLSAIAYMRI